MSSNQNNSNEEPDVVPASEQNELPANNAQPPLENEQVYTSETSPLILQTEPPMEVHHHGHVHETKKWKEYLFQFFMLFLAVFCGFLAEYQLEHLIEKEREKKYVVSMITDLSEDTTRLNRSLTNCVNKFNSISKLIELLNKDQISVEDETSLYETYFQSVGIPAFISNDRTSRQLLNSGNMRLIKKTAVADSIIDYYGPNKEFTDAITGDIKYYTYEANLFSQDIFEFTAMKLNLNPDTTMSNELQPEKMKLLTRDKYILRKYANKNAACRGMTGNYIQHLLKLKRRAIGLIKLLKAEYHLK